DENALVGQHPFQPHARINAFLIVIGLQTPQPDALPGTEENADFALGRQRAPITPHGRPFAFLLGRLAEGVRVNVSRVHPLVEQLNRLALAGGVHALDLDKDGEALLLHQLQLGVQQRLAQTGLLRLVDILGNAVIQFRRFKHELSVSKLARSASDEARIPSLALRASGVETMLKPQAAQRSARPTICCASATMASRCFSSLKLSA